MKPNRINGIITDENPNIDLTEIRKLFRRNCQLQLVTFGQNGPRQSEKIDMSFNFYTSVMAVICLCLGRTEKVI